MAEGRSGAGTGVRPLKTARCAAANPPAKPAAAAPPGPPDVVVQTLSLVYTRLHGVPINRWARPIVGWFGDMEMQSHAWSLLKAGPLDVRIRIGAPIPLGDFADRKDLARRSEAEIRENVVRLLRSYPEHDEVVVTAPAAEERTSPLPTRGSPAFREFDSPVFSIALTILGARSVRE